VRYTGKIFTFYNKLQNVGRQYGIYLQALDDIKYEVSLCPHSYNGQIFTDVEYENMAATLYEKLGHTDVIPDQYNRFRNIIDRYVDSNDGFLMLYEMLEEEHPAMKQDPIQHPPTSSECQDDIQEYSARFTSYLVSERLNGRTYRSREQVVLFLKGLDSKFAPAVQYIETLMDLWGKDGLNPKCELRYLPRTIEAFMKTHLDSTPIMRTTKLQEITTENILDIIRAANQRDVSKKGKTEPSDGPRKSVDVYCDACGSHGHRWRDCDYLAKLITCLNFLNSLDAAKKKSLLETFHKEQVRKRSAKQNNATVRAMQYLEDNDMHGMYSLIQELQTDEATKSMDLSNKLDEDHPE
jgi:hypothetical protein